MLTRIFLLINVNLKLLLIYTETYYCVKFRYFNALWMLTFLWCVCGYLISYHQSMFIGKLTDKTYLIICNNTFIYEIKYAQGFSSVFSNFNGVFQNTFPHLHNFGKFSEAYFIFIFPYLYGIISRRYITCKHKNEPLSVSQTLVNARNMPCVYKLSWEPIPEFYYCCKKFLMLPS